MGPSHRHPMATERLYDDPGNGTGDKTVWRIFSHGAEKFPNANCFGTRRYQKDANGAWTRGDFVWLSYAQARQDAINLGKGFRELGLARGENVGICAINRTEWVTANLANGSQGLRTVALYDTLGENTIEYIVNHAEIKLAVVSKQKLKQVINVLSKCPTLKTIVQMDYDARYGNEVDKVDEADAKQAEQHGAKLVGFTDVLKLGEKSSLSVEEATSDDLAYIMYTSGTTGVPKGALLTHGNISAAVAGAVAIGVDLDEKDRFLSYLPLAHIFETVIQARCYYGGTAIGFYQGDVRKLTDDIKELRPSLLCGVPRVFSRVYSGLMAKIEQAFFIKRNVVKNTILDQRQRIRRGEPPLEKNDKILAKIREALGLDQCKIIVTGGAPIPPYLMEFLKAVINPKLGVLQGYGLTETSAATTVSAAEDHTLGHVGVPIPSVEVRLKDIPDMKYLHSDQHPRGEVQIRGPTVFLGYYKNEAATKEVIDEDGWFSTGDVGRWNPSGTLSIIDRKKNIFKLAQGEYVAAEKIEMAYSKCRYVNQSFVYGNSFKTFLVAIVVPAVQPILDVATKEGWWHSKAALGTPEFRADFKALLQSKQKELSAFMLKELEEVGVAGKLLAFERVKGVYLEGDIDDALNGFTVENECLTPSFKLRRQNLVVKYKQDIINLYTANGEPPKGDERW